jgi:hypothetical protein
MSFANGKPVHVPSPSVPGGDQGADDLSVSLGHQEGSRRIGNEELDIVEVVRGACMLTSRLRPKIQYGRYIGRSASTHGDSLAGQVRSISSLAPPEIVG